MGGQRYCEAPVELGAAELCVCVWSAALLSLSCTDTTLFLFKIRTADFSLHSYFCQTLPPSLPGSSGTSFGSPVLALLLKVCGF